MKSIRERKFWIVLVSVLLLFAACKGESPTAPPPGSGGGPGTTPPASGVSLGLTASNSDPLVDSSVVVTATVTRDGQPVPNGTAVEFRSSTGSLDGAGTSTIKTTTNGVAIVTLTNSAAGPVRVTATVANASRDVNVTFRAQPVEPQPPSTAPTITSVTPSIGRPSGGETIRITGTNFTQPVRVLFDIGKPLPVEAFVVRVSDTEIDVITPRVDLGSGQQLESRIIVITKAGTATEQRVERLAGFTFRNEQLTPRISATSPNSGPVTGGTIVTIFGDGFQAPVQVLFGSAEAKIINVQFSQILVEAPAGRDTAPDGSGTVTGPVPVTVKNINSGTSTTLPDGFRYVSAMQITAAGPTEGPASGGTRVTIDGIGFVAPVAVSIGGVAAMPLEVTGSRIVAQTSPLANPCADTTPQAITVTNIVNGDTASGPSFSYRAIKPLVVGVTPSQVTAGGNVSVRVANALPGTNRIGIGEKTLFPTTTTLNSDGTTTFVVAVPTTFEFGEEACTGSGGVQGTRPAPISVDVTYTNVETGCTDDSAVGALTIAPPNNSCILPPAGPPVAAVTPTFPACANVALSGASGSAVLTVSNTAPAGSQTLIVNSVTFTTTENVTSRTVTPTQAIIAAGGSAQFTVNVTPTAPGPFRADLQFGTNAGGTVQGCVSGTAPSP